MKIFFATGAREYTFLLLMAGARNILCSFAYPEPFRIKPILKKHNVKLMTDSGAFTAWSKGKEVNIDEYIQFIVDNIEVVDEERIVNLDIILGGRRFATQEQFDEACKKGFDNYYYMKAKLKEKLGRDIDPIHVFHQGENYVYLEKMLKECTYIGISPNNDNKDDVKERWLQECFEIIKKINPNIKTHAFGVTSWQLLSKFPYTTADSSAWALTSAMGSIITPFGRVSISEERADKPDFIDNLGMVQREGIIKYIESFGFSYQLCKKNYKYRNIINIHHFLNMESKINNREFDFTDNQQRLFSPYKLAREAYDKLQEKISQNDVL